MGRPGPRECPVRTATCTVALAHGRTSNARRRTSADRLWTRCPANQSPAAVVAATWFSLDGEVAPPRMARARRPCIRPTLAPNPLTTHPVGYRQATLKAERSAAWWRALLSHAGTHTVVSACALGAGRLLLDVPLAWPVAAAPRRRTVGCTPTVTFFVPVARWDLREFDDLVEHVLSSAPEPRPSMAASSKVPMVAAVVTDQVRDAPDCHLATSQIEPLLGAPDSGNRPRLPESFLPSSRHVSAALWATGGLRRVQHELTGSRCGWSRIVSGVGEGPSAEHDQVNGPDALPPPFRNRGDPVNPVRVLFTLHPALENPPAAAAEAVAFRRPVDVRRALFASASRPSSGWGA